MQSNVIVFPAAEHDISAVHSDFIEEADAVRSLGGDVIFLDMQRMANGEIHGTGFQSVTDERQCFFRLNERVSPDFYQLMRWKLGVHGVEAVMNTADYSAVRFNHVSMDDLYPLMRLGTHQQQQWWVGGELVLSVDNRRLRRPVDIPEEFMAQLSSAVQRFGRKFVVVRIVRSRRGVWGVGGINEGQTTPLPVQANLQSLFSALLNFVPK